MITRAHHDAAGMCIGKEVMDALDEATAEQERARQKGNVTSSHPPRLPECLAVRLGRPPQPGGCLGRLTWRH